MKKEITTWKETTLYPKVFDELDMVFPELEFKKDKGGWISKYKMDGSHPQKARKDKSVCTKKVPKLYKKKPKKNQTDRTLGQMVKAML